jgi:serine/threonine protein kinase
LDLLQDIAAGVQYLHASEVVHGDLSGNNVLIDGRGKACLTDFGLSTASGGFQGASYFGQAGRHGAIRWAAPELVVGIGQHSTFESDVYSFGSVMLQVLSGEVPWSEVAAEHIIIQKLTDGQIPRRPSTVSRIQWKFIRKCWLPSHRNSTRPSASEIVDYLKNTQIHGWRSPDSTLHHTAASLLHWITARTASPASRRQAEPGNDGILQVLDDTATNSAAVHATIETSSNERFFMPNENVTNHAFVHDDTKDKNVDVKTLSVIFIL